MNNNHRKLICISRTIYDLSVWNKPLIDRCQYCLTSRANQVLCSLANTGFQNWGVCLQVIPSFLPSPSPPLSFIFWLSFHFLRGQNRESCSWVFLCSKTKWKCLLCRLESHVTLAFSSLLYVFETSIVPCQSSKGRVKGLFILTQDSIRPYLTISERTCTLTAHAFSPFN